MAPRKTILVVDDEPDLVEVVRYNLEGRGFRVVTAATGEEALRAVRRHRPDLVVLDVMLPDRFGTEVCRTLRAEPRTRELPILFLSARTEEVDRVVGLELGADDYVTKPFSPRELVLRVEAILRRTAAAAG
ncbi:MAG: response regulator, partial [Nitrospirae bacterium]